MLLIAEINLKYVAHNYGCKESKDECIQTCRRKRIKTLHKRDPPKHFPIRNTKNTF